MRRSRVGLVEAHDLERQGDVAGRWSARDRAPAPGRHSHRRAFSRASSGVMPLTVMVPPVGRSRSAMTRSNVVLPQPDGPMNETNSPRSTVEVDVGERIDRAVVGLEGERQMSLADDRRPSWPRRRRPVAPRHAQVRHRPRSRGSRRDGPRQPSAAERASRRRSGRRMRPALRRGMLQHRSTVKTAIGGRREASKSQPARREVSCRRVEDACVAGDLADGQTVAAGASPKIAVEREDRRADASGDRREPNPREVPAMRPITPPSPECRCARPGAARSAPSTSTAPG